MTGREAALKSLSAYRQRGAYSSDALKSAAEELEPRESALASVICFGVLQNMFLLDWCIARFSSVKPAKMEPRVLDILRISVYQILFLDRIPDSAAVNEAVKLTKKYSNPRASSLVNAVLRKISQNAESLRAPDISGNDIRRLSVTYSHPEWLVSYYSKTLGKDGAESVMKANNTAAPVYLQSNTLKATVGEIECSLISDGADFTRHPWLEGCFELNGRPDTLTAFKEGLVYVQDPAACASVRASGIAPGMRVLDVCSAPGGKSYAAAINMHGRGDIISCDIHENKLSRVRSGAERLGIDFISTRALDARHACEEFKAEFDTVICDVPCSGIGIIRKKPEIRYKNDDELKGLPQIQLDILRSASKCVRPGGILIYSTCTVLRRENEDVISAFLPDSGFTCEPFTLPEPIGEVSEGFITLWPHIHGTDGFFICKMRKKI